MTSGSLSGSWSWPESLRTSAAGRALRGRRSEFDARAGAVALDEYLVGNAANVRFADLVDLVELAKDLRQSP